MSKLPHQRLQDPELVKWRPRADGDAVGQHLVEDCLLFIRVRDDLGVDHVCKEVVSTAGHARVGQTVHGVHGVGCTRPGVGRACLECHDRGAKVQRQRVILRAPGEQQVELLTCCGVDTVIGVPLAARHGGGWPCPERRGQRTRGGAVPGRVDGVPGLLQRGREVVAGSDRKRCKPKLCLEVARPAESVGNAVIPAEPDEPQRAQCWHCKDHLSPQ